MNVLVYASTLEPLSGGRVAHYLIKTLRELGAEVFVATRQPGEEVPTSHLFILPAEKGQNIAMHFFRGSKTKSLLGFVETNKIQVIYFCSIDLVTNRFLMEYAHQTGIRTVALLWTYSFYCASTGYAFLRKTHCTRCVKGSTGNAIINRCITTKGSWKAWAIRSLGKQLRHVNCFLVPNTECRQGLQGFGVPSDRMIDCPIPFDIASHSLGLAETEPYFLFYSNPFLEKGTEVFSEVVARLPDIKFVYAPGFVNRWVKSLESFPNCKLVTTTVATGLTSYIAAARGVLLPTMWATTGEYCLFEAMAQSKAIVAFNVGVHKLLLRNDTNAKVITPYDVAEFCSGVRHIDKDVDYRMAIGKNARITLERIHEPGGFKRIVALAMGTS